MDSSDASEASWFGYAEKVKPGSRHGTGGRKARADPPWTRDRTVIEVLRSMKFDKKREFDEDTVCKLQSIMLGTGSAALSRNLRDELFCRKIPYVVLEDSPIVKIMSDFTRTETAWFLACSEDTAQCSVNDLRQQQAKVVFFGINMPVKVNLLISALPYIHGLALSANNLSSTDLKELFLELQGNDSVRTLSFTENSLCDAGCSYVQSCLVANERIESLFLCSNEIGDDGAKLLSEVLMPCPCFGRMETCIAEDCLGEFLMLLRHGYPTNGLGASLLYKAVEFGSVRIAEYLLNSNAEPDTNELNHFLIRASAMGHLPLIQLLISRNADISYRNSEGKTALLEAACRGHEAIAQALTRMSRFRRAEIEYVVKSIELIPEVITQKSTDGKRTSLISWLPFDLNGSHSAPNTAIVEKPPALHEERSSKIGDGGLNARVDEIKECPIEQDTPGFGLVLELALGSQIVNLHFQCPARPVELQINKSASFIIAEQSCISYDTELNALLGSSDAPMQQPGGLDAKFIGQGKVKLASFGFPATHNDVIYFPLFGKSGGVSAIIRLSAIVKSPFLNETSKLGNTALHEACREGHIKVVKVLAENGADVNCKDPDGNSPLITSTRAGFEDIVKVLLSYDASPFITNRAGISALMAAQRHNFTTIVQILQCHDMVAHRVPLGIKRLHIDNRASIQMEYEGVYMPFSFQLTISECRNLPIADVTGLSDPFCRVTLNHQEKKTRVVHRNLNPKWNQTFVFDNSLLSVWEKSSLRFEILDSNFVTDSTLLGHRNFHMLQFAATCPEICNEWAVSSFFLESSDGSRLQNADQVDSVLYVKFKVSKGIGQYLRVGVIGATNLPLAKTRNSEAFCSLRFGDQDIDSPPFSRSSSVSWNFFVNFKAKRIDESLKIEIREVYASKKSIQKTECLATLEISPSILAYLISCNLPEMDFEIYDGDGIPLKGPGGYISSIRLEIALAVYEPSNSLGSVLATNSGSVQNLLEKGTTCCHPSDSPRNNGRQSSQLEQLTTLNQPRCLQTKECNVRCCCSDAGIGPGSSSQGADLMLIPEIRPESINTYIESACVTGEKGTGSCSDMMHLNTTHTNNMLVNLDLDQNKISDYGVTQLARSLRANNVLKTLSINDNRIGSAGAAALSKCLELNSCLTHLHISKNHIKDEGLREICKAITSNANTKLLLLDFGENGIGAIGMRFVGRLLACNRTLQVLDLNKNCVGGDGSFLIAQGLRKNSSMQELDLSSCVLGDFGVQHLAQCFQRNHRVLGKTMAANRSLRILNISRNRLTEKSVRTLIDCIQHNQAIHTIILDDNDLPLESLGAMSMCLRQNILHAQLVKAVIKIQRAFRLSKLSKLRKECTKWGATNFQPNSDSRILVSDNQEQHLDREEDEVPGVEAHQQSQPENFILHESHDLQSMLVTATGVTMFNLGDAVILEHAAAYALAQEAALKLSVAAENYSKLEDQFYRLLLDEDSDQKEIVSAVDQLALARDSILKAIEESRLAEEAGMKCFQGAEAFAICESEEEKLLEALHENARMKSNAMDLEKMQDSCIECEEHADFPNAYPSETQLISKRAMDSFDCSISNQTLNGSHVEIYESEDDLISSAFQEFFGKLDDSSFSPDQKPTARLEQLKNQLLVLRDEEIAACSSTALHELNLCMQEVSDLNRLIAGEGKSDEVQIWKSDEVQKFLSAAAERCAHLENKFCDSLSSVQGQASGTQEFIDQLAYSNTRQSNAMDLYLPDSEGSLKMNHIDGCSDEDLISDALNEFFHDTLESKSKVQ